MIAVSPPTHSLTHLTRTNALTSGYDDVSMAHGGGDAVVIGGLHKLIILLEHAVEVTTPLRDVTAESSRQTDVGVRVDKHLHVAQLERGESRGKRQVDRY